VRAKRALAFVGTGVTSLLGYPSWGTLITDLAVRAAHDEQLQSNGQEITVDQVLREFELKPLVQAQILKEPEGWVLSNDGAASRARSWPLGQACENDRQATRGSERPCATPPE
jgi:hypothetical protein